MESFENSNVKVFSLETGSYYVYDPNVNAFAGISLDDASGIRSKQFTHRLGILMDYGFFRGNRIKKILHPETYHIKEILTNKMEGVTLQITQNCNLKCSYCPYSGTYDNRGHQNKRMKFEDAKMCIDFLESNSSQMKKVSIGLYGGEPLTEVELIRDVMEYATNKIKDKEVHFSLTTNGTILSDEIIHLLILYNVNLVVSIDGPKKLHDMNRTFINGNGTHDKIMENIKYIRENFPSYYSRIRFNSVLNPECDYSCVFNFFVSADEFDPDKCMISSRSDYYIDKPISNSKAYMDNYNDSLLDLFLYHNGYKDELCLNAHMKMYSELLFKEFDHNHSIESRLPDEYHHGGPCVPGATRLFIDVEGNFLPCERVSELSKVMDIGSIHEGFNYENVSNILNVGKVSEERCKKCWSIRFCKLCAASADNLNKLDDSIKVKYCHKARKSNEQMVKDYLLIRELKER